MLIMGAEDYHDLDLSGLILNKKYKIIELGKYRHTYYGVAYSGKKPSNIEIALEFEESTGINILDLE